MWPTSDECWNMYLLSGTLRRSGYKKFWASSLRRCFVKWLIELGGMSYDLRLAHTCIFRYAIDKRTRIDLTTVSWALHGLLGISLDSLGLQPPLGFQHGVMALILWYNKPINNLREVFKFRVFFYRRKNLFITAKSTPFLYVLKMLRH